MKPPARPQVPVSPPAPLQVPVSPPARLAPWARAAAIVAGLSAAAVLAFAPRPSPAQPPPPAAPLPASAAPATSAQPLPASTASAASAASAAPSPAASSASASSPAAPAAPFPIDTDEGPLPAIDHTPYPIVPEKHVAPKPKEWADAPRVRFTRRGLAASTCQLRRVREWLRVRCDGDMLAVGQVAGNPEGVVVWVHEPKDVGLPVAAEVTFPMRPGDRRIFQLFGFQTYGGPVPYPADGPILQAYWIEGAPAPVVLVR